MGSLGVSAEEILKNKLDFLETETDNAKDIDNVGHRRPHYLSSYHPGKRNLWTEWLLYFNGANKNEKVDKNELKKLLTRYIKLFEKFRVKKCPPIWQNIKGNPCTIVLNSLSKLSEKYDLNYSRVPSLIELASIKVPEEEYDSVSGMEIDPRAAESRKGGKKRKTKKNKRSKKERKKRKTKKNKRLKNKYKK